MFTYIYTTSLFFFLYRWLKKRDEGYPKLIYISYNNRPANKKDEYDKAAVTPTPAVVIPTTAALFQYFLLFNENNLRISYTKYIYK